MRSYHLRKKSKVVRKKARKSTAINPSQTQLKDESRSGKHDKGINTNCQSHDLLETAGHLCMTKGPSLKYEDHACGSTKPVKMERKKAT